MKGNQREKREEFLKRLLPETKRIFLAKMKEIEEEGTFEVEWYGDKVCLTSFCFKGCISDKEALLLSYIADFTTGGGYVSNAERCKVGTKYLEVADVFVELWPRVRLHKGSLVAGLAKLREAYLFGDYDFALNFNPKNKVIVDIGAWVGEVSIRLAKSAKKVFSLEPNPYAYTWLRENADLSEVFLDSFNAQIGKRGEVKFEVPKLMMESIGIKEKVVTIRSLPLEELLDLWGVKEGDYIRIACCGKSILKGEVDLLKKFDHIVFEYSKNPLVFEVLLPRLRKWKYKFAIMKPYPYLSPRLEERGIVIAKRT